MHSAKTIAGGDINISDRVDFKARRITKEIHSITRKRSFNKARR